MSQNLINKNTLYKFIITIYILVGVIIIGTEYGHISYKAA